MTSVIKAVVVKKVVTFGGISGNFIVAFFFTDVGREVQEFVHETRGFVKRLHWKKEGEKSRER